MDRLLMIPITALKNELERIPDFAAKPIEERAKLAMKHVHSNNVCFMTPSDDQKFRSACGALILLSSEPEQARINRELRMLQTLSAAMSGVPVDFSSMCDDEDAEPPLGLMGIYRESIPPSPWAKP